jgi:NADPH-dependent glutamate synthase beta subunit-like oxidoreductase
VKEGAAYLAAANACAPPKLGRRVVAIGGGSAAMDVARSARRAGHEVSVLALESELQMPAQREEVLAAKEEGVRLFDHCHDAAAFFLHQRSDRSSATYTNSSAAVGQEWTGATRPLRCGTRR